jgi:hypothetical protein
MGTRAGLCTALSIVAVLAPALAWSDPPASADAPLLEAPSQGDQSRELYIGQQLPQGARLLEESSVLTTIGAGTLALTYFTSAYVGYMLAVTSSAFGSSPLEGLSLFIPAIGPFGSYFAARADSPFRAMYLVDGIVQSLALGLIVWGKLSTRKYVVFPQSAQPVVAPQVQLFPGAPGSPIGATVRLAGW